MATPFFEGEGYEQLKACGLRDALISLLDDLMVEHSSQGTEFAWDGVLKLGSGKVVLEWLPDGAARDVSDARRSNWNLIPRQWSSWNSSSTWPSSGKRR